MMVSTTSATPRSEESLRYGPPSAERQFTKRQNRLGVVISRTKETFHIPGLFAHCSLCAKPLWCSCLAS